MIDIIFVTLLICIIREACTCQATGNYGNLRENILIEHLTKINISKYGTYKYKEFIIDYLLDWLSGVVIL